MTHVVVDKRSDHAKPHSICFFFFYHNINVQENGFFSERELKKALGDTLTRAALSGLLIIDNGKLANQIARLVAIVESVFTSTRRSTSKRDSGIMSWYSLSETLAWIN